MTINSDTIARAVAAELTDRFGDRFDVEVCDRPEHKLEESDGLKVLLLTAALRAAAGKKPTTVRYQVLVGFFQKLTATAEDVAEDRPPDPTAQKQLVEEVAHELVGEPLAAESRAAVIEYEIDPLFEPDDLAHGLFTSAILFTVLVGK